MEDCDSLLNGADASQFLANLLDKECWGIIAGPGTGSMVKLQFGEKILRDRPVRNDKLSELNRNFTGKYSVFIEHAEWEIFELNESICDSTDDNALDGAMLAGLNKLCGKPVLDVRVALKSASFSLYFPGELRLAVYCDDLDVEGPCYGLFCADSYKGTVMCKR